MNCWQVLRQIAYKLGAATWPDSPAEVVFGPNGVFATAGVAGEAIGRVRLPCAIVRPLNCESDDEHPEIVTQGFEVNIIAQNQADAMGVGALIGYPRSGGQGSSKGRGVLELMEEVLKAVGELTQATGVCLKEVHRSSAEAVQVDGMGFVATQALVLEGVIGRERYYHPATRLAATTPGGGQVSLTWALPPDRYDRQRMVLRRAAGATAPASATAGTGVTLASDLATSVTDTPTAGQFSYALFVGYDEDGDGVVDRYSAAATKTVTAV